VQIIRDLKSLAEAIKTVRQSGESLALVPTMGALHEGHMTLVRQAKAVADRVIVSIFVNPTQFGPNEDLAAYPRREQADAAMLMAEGCDMVWVPDVATMYPDGFSTTISVSDVTEGYCGAARPGHFDGVATVVAKLFNQIRPDVALFGEKDYQQLAVIRRMVRDLDIQITVTGVETVREADGLALSSRNAYLGPVERAQAAALPGVLHDTAQALTAGTAVMTALEQGKAALIAAGFIAVDYLALADAVTLAPLDRLDRPARLLVAARIGKARLIDNIAVAQPA
jgi:pantoate--beta-alanine ligase